MKKPEQLGIAVGRTVTKTIIESVAEASWPDAALAELWLGRTINKTAFKLILAALKQAKSESKTKEAKESEG